MKSLWRLIASLIEVDPPKKVEIADVFEDDWVRCSNDDLWRGRTTKADPPKLPPPPTEKVNRGVDMSEVGKYIVVDTECVQPGSFECFFASLELAKKAILEHYADCEEHEYELYVAKVQLLCRRKLILEVEDAPN